MSYKEAFKYRDDLFLYTAPLGFTRRIIDYRDYVLHETAFHLSHKDDMVRFNILDVYQITYLKAEKP